MPRIYHKCCLWYRYFSLYLALPNTIFFVIAYFPCIFLHSRLGQYGILSCFLLLFHIFLYFLHFSNNLVPYLLIFFRYHYLFSNSFGDLWHRYTFRHIYILLYIVIEWKSIYIYISLFFVISLDPFFLYYFRQIYFQIDPHYFTICILYYYYCFYYCSIL